MGSSPTSDFSTDKKDIRPSDDLPLPPASDAQRRRQPSHLRRALTWVVIACAVVYAGSRFGWHLSVRRRGSSFPDAAVDNETPDAKMLQAEGDEPEVKAGNISALYWELQTPVFLDGGIVYPTDESCLVEWNTTSREPSLIATPLGKRQFHATSDFALRQDVHAYVVDSLMHSDGSSVQLHVVPSSEGQATVSVGAFYDDPAALDVFYACTYHADETAELISQHRIMQRMPMAIPANGLRGRPPAATAVSSRAHHLCAAPTQNPDIDPSTLQKSDVIRLHRRDTNYSEREAGADVWFNITLSIPSDDRKYSLHSNSGFDIDLSAGLALNDVRLGGGRIVAREGFTARGLNVNSRNGGTHDGIFGHFSSRGNVSLTTAMAPIDAHVEVSHTLDQSVQTVFLATSQLPLKATLALRGEPAHSVFKINAHCHESPLNLTISDGSSYTAVNIDAEARNAPAYLSLDPSFEGAFIAKAIDSESEGASVAYPQAERYPVSKRVFQKPLKTRHLHAGAVGRDGEEVVEGALSFAEVRSVGSLAHIDL